MTPEELEAGKTAKGGYTKKQLAKWGVPYPPPKGWKEALLAGKTAEEAGLLEGPTADDLLRQVVLAVVEAGHAQIIERLPDVLAHFGARMPTRAELEAAGVKGRAIDG